LQRENESWFDSILPTRQVIDDSMSHDYVAGKMVLITGAGGSIGAALAQWVVSAKAREVLLLDHAENALYQLGRSLSSAGGAPYRLVPGDAGDLLLMAALLEEHRPDLILHAAAYKHVPLMEANPFAAVANNTILTWRLARTAAESGVPQFLFVSTDKAANPRSILGASKRAAELAALRWSAPGRRYCAIRLVNVLGSAGSVVPTFLEQIARGGPVTVTHRDATRHFITLEDTVRLILIAAALPESPAVYVPRLEEPLRVLELANELIRRAVPAIEKKIQIEFTGLRAGEKLAEEILGSNESASPSAHPAIHVATSPEIAAERIDRAIHRMEECVERRDLPALLETICRLVPEYEPSAALCAAERISHE
jgi:FlaA1/EpsC-like NDP-sugar epimerase